MGATCCEYVRKAAAAICTHGVPERGAQKPGLLDGPRTLTHFLPNEQHFGDWPGAALSLSLDTGLRVPESQTVLLCLGVPPHPKLLVIPLAKAT